MSAESSAGGAAAAPTTSISDGATTLAAAAAERRAFFASKNAARKARELATHAAAQALLQEQKNARDQDSRLEAVEWCRKHMQIDAAALALRLTPGASVLQRSVLLLHFSGARYKGMQIQNRSQVPSIEGEVLKALYRAGGVGDEPDLSIQQMRWQRTARTDAGVHAAFNVLSCILRYDGALMQRINEALPPDIRVMHIMPVAEFGSDLVAPASSSSTAAAATAVVAADSSSARVIAAAPYALAPFHAKNSCTGRVYEYIMPSSVWGLHPIVAPAEVVDVPKDEEVKSSAASEPAAATAERPSTGAQRSATSATAAPLHLSKRKSKKKKRAVATASAGPAAADPTPSPFRPLFSSTAAASAPPIDFASFGSARLSPDDIARLNDILAQFVGSRRSFHNFAKVDKSAAAEAGEDGDASAGASSSMRSVSRFVVSDLIMRDGVEYTRLVIEGPSFMLHQIRKMVALATLVSRRMVDKSIFETVFTPGTLYDVPIAPARGLLLRRAFFTHYDAACDATHQPHLSISRAYESKAVHEQMAAFDVRVLEAEVCHSRNSYAAYRAWIQAVQEIATKSRQRTEEGEQTAVAV